MSGLIASPWAFSSKRRSRALGLVYYSRRCYIPEFGRWLTPDPAGFTDGMNLYAFVGNEPLMHFDEYGLWLKPRAPGSFNSSEIMQGWLNDVGQFSTGFNRGVMNSAFNTCRLANTLVHGLASPFHCFNWENKCFDFSMGSSYHSMNQWLGGTQQLADKFLFSGRDPNHWGSSIGEIGGQAVGDLLIGAGAIKGISRIASYGKTGFQRFLELKNYMNPHKIRFSQPTISQNFSNISAVNANRVQSAENFLTVGNFRYTTTSGNHINDIVKKGPFKGELSRPYMKSSLMIDEIMAARSPVPDPGGVPGALRWDVPGMFRQREGIWELVLHPENGIIYHFNFQ